EARVWPPRIVGLEQDAGDEKDRGMNCEDGLRLGCIPELGRPVRPEPQPPREDPARPERDHVQRGEPPRTERHLGPWRWNKLKRRTVADGEQSVADGGQSAVAGCTSAATRVPHATIVQNTPMILYEAKVSTSAALMDAAVTASAAPYTIARRNRSV